MDSLPGAVEDRYSRQILFPGIGVEGQRRLMDSRVAIIGVGATGAASASILARAGVGHLTLIDRDVVETTNLQRQMLFDEKDAMAGTPKAEAARAQIARFNSGIQAHAVVADLTPENIHAVLSDAHLLLDCTDNFETRYLLNDFAVQQRKPWIYAGALGAQAAGMNIVPKGSAHILTIDGATGCLCCLFPTPPSGPIETCDTSGVLGSAVHLAASVQTAEAVKLLTGQLSQMRRSFLAFDLWTNQRSEITNTTPDPACACCERREFVYLMGAGRPHITLCGRNSVQIHERGRTLSLSALERRLRTNPEVTGLQQNSMMLRFHQGVYQVTVFADGRALIQGTVNPAVARTVYARWVGN